MEKCTLELSFTKLEMTKESSPSMATLGSFSLPLTTTTSSFLYTFSHALKAKISFAMRCIFTFYYWQRSMDEILDLLAIIYPMLYLQKIYHWLVSGMDWKKYFLQQCMRLVENENHFNTCFQYFNTCITFLIASTWILVYVFIMRLLITIQLLDDYLWYIVIWKWSREFKRDLILIALIN